MFSRGTVNGVFGSATLVLATFSGVARADLVPDWVSSAPVGSALTAGIAGMVVDDASVTYVTGINGPSSNTDVFTAAFAPDGTLKWSHTYNGPANWHDQGRALALGPGGVLYVAGNTPGPGSYANVLVLAYDAASGSLLDVLQYSSGPFTSEAGLALATDSRGNVYVGCSTVGDGGDGMVLKLDAALALQWKQVWDGPASAPYSQDVVLQMKVAPDGALVALVHGVMNSLHPDYVVVKYDAGDGSPIWQATWGSNGEDAASDMAMDAAGDVYVTGTAIHFTDQYSTIKLRGTDGQLLWQAYDFAGIDDAAAAIALDGQGGVCVTGRVDHDGDQSNFNDNIYTVRRDATSGTFLWSHEYGTNGIGHFDVPADVIVDPAGNVFVAGYTSSPPYSGDTITLVLDVATGTETTRGIVPGNATQTATPAILRLDGSYDLLVGGDFYDVNSGALEIFVFRYPALATGVGGFVDLGSGLAGSFAPSLDGMGSLAGGAAFTLSVTGLPPSQLGLLVLGLSEWSLPFRGGVLVPAPDLLLRLPSGAGFVNLQSSIPPGAPAGASLYLQGWWPDAGAPQGLCATNGLELALP